MILQFFQGLFSKNPDRNFIVDGGLDKNQK